MKSIGTKSVFKLMKKDPRTHAIIGAAMEVHNIVGPGHLEAVYQECLEIEFKLRNISFIPQPRLKIFIKIKSYGNSMFLISLFMMR